MKRSNDLVQKRNTIICSRATYVCFIHILVNNKHQHYTRLRSIHDISCKLCAY